MFVTSAVTATSFLSLIIMSLIKGSYFYDANGDPRLMDSKTLVTVFVAMLLVLIGINSYCNP